jgi:hypothetical protein
VLDKQSKVILQVLAHPGEIVDERNAQRGERGRITDSGQLE